MMAFPASTFINIKTTVILDKVKNIAAVRTFYEYLLRISFSVEKVDSQTLQ